jgi:hypothetical protein
VETIESAATVWIKNLILAILAGRLGVVARWHCRQKRLKNLKSLPLCPYWLTYGPIGPIMEENLDNLRTSVSPARWVGHGRARVPMARPDERIRSAARPLPDTESGLISDPMARANRTSTSQHQPEHQPEHQHQGPRKGPLGGPAVTIQEPTETPEPTEADPTEAKGPQSLADVLALLMAPKTSGDGLKPFGVTLTEREAQALTFQRAGKDAKWSTYRASQGTKFDPEPKYSAHGSAVPGILASLRPFPAAATPAVKAAQAEEAARLQAGLGIAGLLIERGRVTIGAALLIAQQSGARFQTNTGIATTVKTLMPGCPIRWNAAGELELSPELKLTHNELTKALASFAKDAIKAASQVK